MPDLGIDYPDPLLEVPDEDRAARTSFAVDHCTVTAKSALERFFLRGVVRLRIHDTAEVFTIGAWVEVPAICHRRWIAKEEIADTIGVLVNRIRHYVADTTHLRARLLFPSPGERPELELEPSDHPFAREQREGITLDRAWAIVHHYLKP